jgi:glycosyltransferase involved in cell wall biosynthesis
VDHATSGLLVPPGDPQELRAALDHMLADSKARQDMGLAGRAKVSDDFNIHTEAARLSRLFTSYSGGSTVLEKRP